MGVPNMTARRVTLSARDGGAGIAIVLGEATSRMWRMFNGSR